MKKDNKGIVMKKDNNGSVNIELLDNTIADKDDIFAINGLLESVLCKEFSCHESSEIVNLLVGFNQYSRELAKYDKNSEDDFNDYLKSYLRVIYPILCIHLKP